MPVALETARIPPGAILRAQSFAAGAHRLEESGETRGEEAGDWLMETHKPGQHSVFRMILEMFHVKRDLGAGMFSFCGWERRRLG